MNILAAEWTKLRTLRSTWVALAMTVAVSAGLSLLVGAAFRSPAVVHFDPLFASYYSLTLGQLALVVFAVGSVGSEYRAGTIRASLAAVPRRGVFYGAKAFVVAVVLTATAVLTVPAAFFVGQAALGPRGVGLDAPDALQAMIGAVLYLVLIGLFALGVAAALRSSAASLGILMPLLLLGSQGLGNIPKVQFVTRFLPDQAGMVIMHLAGAQDDPRWARGYGPWTGIGILALWTAASLLVGFLALRRRDA
jgi:ABC-2 type transport system permease protein